MNLQNINWSKVGFGVKFAGAACVLGACAEAAFHTAIIVPLVAGVALYFGGKKLQAS